MQLSLVERVHKIPKLLQRLKHVGHRRWIFIPGVIAILFFDQILDLLFGNLRYVAAPIRLLPNIRWEVRSQGTESGGRRKLIRESRRTTFSDDLA